DDLLERLPVGLDAGQLRADVALEAAQLERGEREDAPRERGAALDVDAELRLFLAGRDVRVRLRVDVGVEADRDARAAAAGLRAVGQDLDLLLALDVEEEDPGLQRLLHLLARLPHAREDDRLRLRADGKHAAQLARGDDVEPRALAAHDVQEREVAVRLER